MPKVTTKLNRKPNMSRSSHSSVFPFIDTWYPKYDEDPISALTELAAIRKWRLYCTPIREIGPVHSRLYAIGIVINGWKFRDVEGWKKKQAKRRAYHTTMKVIYMRSMCILQDKIPEEEVVLALSLELSIQDIVVSPNFDILAPVYDPPSSQTVKTELPAEPDFSNDNFNPVFITQPPIQFPMYIPKDAPEDIPRKKKRKLASEVTTVKDRSPVMILLTYFQPKSIKVNFEVVSVTGEGFYSKYTVKLTVGDKTYPLVTAHSKKAARHNAAVIAIKEMTERGEVLVLDPDTLTIQERPPIPVPIKQKLLLPLPKERIDTEFFRHAVTILSEYAVSNSKKLKFDSVHTDNEEPIRFEMAAIVGDRTFSKIKCTTKRVGRVKASDTAIREILAGGETIPSLHTGYLEMKISDGMSHADKMGSLSHSAVNHVFNTLEPMPGHKVAATIVMKDGDDVGKVVCVGVGNKICSNTAVDTTGEVVNDSHCPVIARRSFIRFLYQELQNYMGSRNSEMFTESSTGKFQIRHGVTFHMYMSAAPCGDASAFSPSTASMEEVYARDAVTPIYINPGHGALQTKILRGTTIVAHSDKLDEMLASATKVEKLQTMSCSDKICRWNVLGLQGALLSHFLDPVYLSSLTLGNYYHGGHLIRAIAMRLQLDSNEPLQDELPAAYHLNIPETGKLTMCKPPRDIYKLRQYSVNWMVGDDLPESTVATTGKIATKGEETGQPSRLCKAELYKQFKNLCKKFNRDDLVNFLSSETYRGAKMAATDYQKAKAALKKRFVTNNFGEWMGKPEEADCFK